MMGDRKPPKKDFIAPLLLVTSALVWGLAWPVGRLLALDLPPVTVAVLRYLMVVPVFFLLLRLKEGRIAIPKNWIPVFLILGILSVTLYQAFFLFGVRYTAASDASLLIGTAPVVIALMASLFIGERLTGKKAVGIGFAFAGIALIALLSENTHVENRFLGDALVMGSVLVHSAYTVLLRRFFVNERGSSLVAITWVSLFGLLALLPFFLLESPWQYSWAPAAWAEILYLALFSTVIGYLFFAEGVRRLGAASSGIFINLVPVFGVLFSIILLGEAVNGWYILSFLLIVMGVRAASKK